jgi:TonB family protein
MPIRLTPTTPQLDEPEGEIDSRLTAGSDSAETAEPGEGSSSGNNGRRLSYSRGRYEELDHTDLLRIIDDLEGDRNWASLREKLWIALIIHMAIAWYLFYGPKYIYHVRVVDPSVVMKQRQKDLTFLDLPPDALKPLKPHKPTNIISDKDRVAQTPHPTLDRKTLRELEAMRRAGPPAPAPAPAPPQQQSMPNLPETHQPQVAQEHQPTPPAQPLPQNNQARLEAPPQAPEPSFNAGGSSNPNEQMQQAMRQAMRGSAGQYGGDGGQDLNPQHQGMNGAVDVLSDTMGVDFGPYIQRVIWDTKRAWYPIIPESARPPLNKQGRVMIRFKIFPDGTVRNMVLEGPSGDVALDRAAWAGITGAAPFPPLPRVFHGPFLELRFYFLYNIRPGEE